MSTVLLEIPLAVRLGSFRPKNYSLYFTEQGIYCIFLCRNWTSVNSGTGGDMLSAAAIAAVRTIGGAINHNATAGQLQSNQDIDPAQLLSEKKGSVYVPYDEITYFINKKKSFWGGDARVIIKSQKAGKMFFTFQSETPREEIARLMNTYRPDLCS